MTTPTPDTHPIDNTLALTYQGRAWYEVKATDITEVIRRRIAHAEAGRLNAIMDLLESEAAYLVAPTTHPAKVIEGPVQATNLDEMIATLRQQITEYDRRIAALLAALDSLTGAS